ncbi:MAG: hypothetical protein HY647_09265 [Acidobacteria bacterium]|nr:hypothetical protein [Acidobacteriota bacterium]
MSIKTIILLLAIGNAAVALRAAEDPFAGTWKLNLFKSKYSQNPPTESATMKIERFGDRVTITREGVDGQWEVTAQLDGQDHPVQNDRNRDTTAIKRIDEYTWEVTNKKDGKVRSSQLDLVSRDGKTLILSWKGTDEQGQPTYNIRVYEKQ